MKATQRDYAQAAQKAAGKLRIFFFCGADEAGASAAARKLIENLDEPGERVELSGSDLRSDPVRLVDEARSTSLFGDTRHILVRASGEEAHDAINTYCELADRGEADAAWPIFIVATSATDKSRSAKLLIKRGDALVAVFYPPDLRSVTADVRAMADAAGMRLNGNLAERIAHAAGLDVRLAQSEVEKLALYLDASPQAPKQASTDDFDAIGASTEEDGFMPLVNAALGGEVRKLPSELRRLREVSLNPVGVALALERRAAQLARLSANMRPGDDMQAFLKSQGVFFREHREVGDQLQRWSGGKLERLVPRLAELHRSLLANSQMAELILAQELAQIARYAAARR
ncbi:DNA polymerase III subunit delta [Aurantiacibacter hainanensis]|uniref:DNA polymerase III subunit delta n=1 Tax=Aurantiacibacter hainanensis TaxID=3076114 RepID=UPI0030C76839